MESLEQRLLKKSVETGKQCLIKPKQCDSLACHSIWNKSSPSSTRSLDKNKYFGFDKLLLYLLNAKMHIRLQTAFIITVIAELSNETMFLKFEIQQKA